MAERTGREQGARRYFKNTRRACANLDEARACTRTNTTRIQDTLQDGSSANKKLPTSGRKKQPARKDHKKSPVITITNLARAACFHGRSQSSHGGHSHCHGACRGEPGRSRTQVTHPRSGNHGTAYRANPRGVGPRAAPPPRVRRVLVAAHPAASPDSAVPWCMLLSKGRLVRKGNAAPRRHAKTMRRHVKTMQAHDESFGNAVKCEVPEQPLNDTSPTSAIAFLK